MATWRRAVLALAVLATASPLFALEVLLLNRQRYVGDVRINPDTVFVKVDKTTYQIPRGSVREVRLYGAEVLDYERRKAQLDVSAESHYRFARWLDSMFQSAQAQTYYQKAIDLDPDHAGAREALGYKQADGRWTLSEEDRWRVRSGWLGPAGADACYELAKLYHRPATRSARWSASAGRSSRSPSTTTPW
jgi:tetratricopeptide (TPR) repeat protein